MKKYRLEIKTAVLRQIDALPGRYRQRVRRTIAELAMNPRPLIAQPLRTFPDRYRIRLDDYRIVYRIEDDLLRRFQKVKYPTVGASACRCPGLGRRQADAPTVNYFFEYA